MEGARSRPSYEQDNEKEIVEAPEIADRPLCWCCRHAVVIMHRPRLCVRLYNRSLEPSRNRAGKALTVFSSATVSPFLSGQPSTTASSFSSSDDEDEPSLSVRGGKDARGTMLKVSPSACNAVI